MFESRSPEKELLDRDDIPTAHLFQNLKELDFINHWLGGYNISFAALKKILKKDRSYKLIDIGCGGGDTLKRIAAWNGKAGFDLALFGIDLKQDCIDYATQNLHKAGATLICDDYKNTYRYLDNVDIIHACLFCHHLSDADIVGLVQFAMKHHAMLVINDLERNWFAYYSISILTRLFSKSYLVKNDARLSVLRGFKKKEWHEILKKAGAKRFSVRNKWAFRHEVIVYGNAD